MLLYRKDLEVSAARRIVPVNIFPPQNEKRMSLIHLTIRARHLRPDQNDSCPSTHTYICINLFCSVVSLCLPNCIERTSCTTADKGLFVDTRYLQLTSISIPLEVETRNLAALVLTEQTAKESYIQQSSIITKETERLVCQCPYGLWQFPSFITVSRSALSCTDTQTLVLVTSIERCNPPFCFIAMAQYCIAQLQDLSFLEMRPIGVFMLIGCTLSMCGSRLKLKIIILSQGAVMTPCREGKLKQVTHQFGIIQQFR